MGIELTSLDLAVFLITTFGIMAIGMWVGRREEGAEDYFLAGRTAPWWAVTGSIFGTNISAEQMVGMLGVGFSIGFAQAHYEIGAIAGLLLLCFVFLPLYLRMRVFTLSEFLARRFGESSRIAYSAISIILMDFIRMVMAFYIGARALSFLLRGSHLEIAYEWGVVLICAVAGAYTIFGGLKAVIWTDVFQSVLLLAAGVFLAALVYSQPEIGGLRGLMALDAARPVAEQKFHLYLPMNHKSLPWTGVFTGLLLLNFNFFATNQFIVQRALAARSGHHARLGIIAAGYLKLLVPFWTIVPGIGAAHLFTARGMTGIKPDDAFPALVGMLVPGGYGLIGLIVAGLVGAILSSVDSMMNSGATMVTFDFYKRFYRKNASEKELILVGRLCVAVFIISGGVIATTFFSPTRESAFFLQLSSATGHFVPGIVAAFCLGVFWRRATWLAGILALTLSPLFSFFATWAYGKFLGTIPAVASAFGPQLNFLHRTALTGLFAMILMIVVSLLTPNLRDSEKEHFVWWNFRGMNEEQKQRGFWRGEGPWTILLIALTIAILVYFA